MLIFIAHNYTTLWIVAGGTLALGFAMLAIGIVRQRRDGR